MDASYLQLFVALSDELEMQYEEQELLSQVKNPSESQVSELASLSAPTLELEGNWNTLVKTYVRDTFERKRISIA